MVRGLKVLRHKRTEAGYFNEFIIAKTPDDVENCLPLPAGSDAPPVFSAATAEMQSLQQQASTYYGTSSHDDDHRVISSEWQLPQLPHQGPAHAASASLQLCFGHADQEQRIVTQPVTMAPASTTEIARHVVVTTSSGVGYNGDNRNGASVIRPQHLDMAAGMSKMKIEIGCARDSSNRRPSSTSDAPPASLESQRKRRERNRAAAARCRKKRQDQLDTLAETVRDLELENAGLESRVAALVAVRSNLLRRLREHGVTCPEGFALPSGCDLEVAVLDTELASMATTSASGDEILLTPSLLLPPPLELHRQADEGAEFKLEPL